jgi:ADP-ribose pyrophosphatase YjhB (NUDIX family)
VTEVNVLSGFGDIFHPAQRHVSEERRRQELDRDDPRAGDPPLGVDLDAGTVRLDAPRSAPRATGPERVRTAGAIIQDGDRRLLLIRRGQPPAEGLWSVPGGHVAPGESDENAVRREVAEETGLDVRVDRLAGEIELPGRSGTVYDNRDYACTVTGGELGPGDDAADARWFALDELRSVPTTRGLLDTLADWDVL